MRIFLYHSSKFNSEVRTTYNKHGLFVSMEVLGAEEMEKTNFEEGIPKTTLYLKLADFLKAAEIHKTKLTEVDRLITFEMFWSKYNYKDCGRNKTEQIWNKLSKEDQIRAFDYIIVLERKLKMSNLAKPYATTYLNQKRWEI